MAPAWGLVLGMGVLVFDPGLVTGWRVRTRVRVRVRVVVDLVWHSADAFPWSLARFRNRKCARAMVIR